MQSLNSKADDFSYLDDPALRDTYRRGKNYNRIIFFIEGMSCGQCVKKIESLNTQLPGLQSIRVDLGRQTAEAEIDTVYLSFASLANKIRDLGFTPIAVNSKEDEITADRVSQRKELIRLGVAAACAGNIMLYSFALYFGNTGTLYAVFSWLNFLLYLPVVTYVAWPFYVGAYRSLKQKRLSIDLPMTAASLTGFIYSTYEFFTGGENFYFDSLSGFIFLILVSRWFQKRLQRKFLSIHDIGHLTIERVKRFQNGQLSWASTDQIRIGDIIRVSKGEIAPAEGQLISPSASISLAWISGESKPAKLTRNSIVPAGSKLLSQNADIKITKTLGQTEFGQILEQVQHYDLSSNRITSVSDQWAQRLLVIVFTLAAAYLWIYWPVNSAEAVRRALALIIVACPCAMAFGTPLALAAALKKARHADLLIRDASVFDKILNVRTLLFDKTGTLTITSLSLTNDPRSYSEEIKSIVLTLEAASQHPIAYAFRKAFENSEPYPAIESWTEEPGQGVSGHISNNFYELKKCDSDKGMPTCQLIVNGDPLAHFSFETEIRPGSMQTLERLRLQGFQTLLVTGDSLAAAMSLGERLKFSEFDIFSDLNATEKAEFVHRHPNSMMIGDGINDSLALMAADVGVAVSGSLETALKSSNIYLTSENLEPLEKIFTIAKEAQTAVRQNLKVSLAYNVVAGSLALSGLITPLVAALLMPFSSGFIIAVTWYRERR